MLLAYHKLIHINTPNLVAVDKFALLRFTLEKVVIIENIVVQPSFVPAHILATYITNRDKKMRNRSRIELASNILEAANGGATKTKIMYKAFLSYAQLQEYLAMLTENSLLLRDGGIYKPTSKGIGFLQTTRQLNGLLELQASQQK